MKKFLFLSLTFPLIFLAGCTSSTKLLARNLDNTITNLIYSVSNLDVIDQKTLQNVSSFTTLGINQSSPFVSVASENFALDNACNENYNNLEDCDSKNCDNCDNSCNENCDSCDNSCNENCDSCDNSCNENCDNCNTLGTCDDDDCKNSDCINSDNCTNQNCEPSDNFNKINPINPNNNLSTTDTHNQNSVGNNSINFGDSLISSDKNARTAPDNTSISESQTDLNVPLSKNALNESANHMQALIDELINIRTVVMLYISDLYNGNVTLSNADVEAINSYANIIKESTAYLKSNNGTVNNHINEAASFIASGHNSSLANSHIIRATEALNTRCAKLEAAIVATYNIAGIIRDNLNKASDESAQTDANLEATSAIVPTYDNFRTGVLSEASPNYSMNNPYNMGVNGMNYGAYGNGGLGYGGYGAGQGFAYNGYANPYMMQNYSAGYGGLGFENYPNSGYGGGLGYNNGALGFSEYYPYSGFNYGAGLGYGYGGSSSPIINEGGAEINFGNGVISDPSGTMPNVLTGLVSEDEQESIASIQTSLLFNNDDDYNRTFRDNNRKIIEHRNKEKSHRNKPSNNIKKVAVMCTPKMTH